MFWYGVIAGLVAVYAYHHFVGLPSIGGMGAGKMKGKGGQKATG